MKMGNVFFVPQDHTKANKVNAYHVISHVYSVYH